MTPKPRISMSMKHETFNVLKALSAKNGQSVASIVNEVLDGVVPALQVVLDATNALAKAEDSKKAQIRAQLEHAEARMMPLLGLITGQADDAISEVKWTAEQHPPTPQSEKEATPDADDERHPAQRPQA